jgi:predicted RNA-binding protein with PUA-like domain
MRYWIFQSNPKNYRLSAALSEVHSHGMVMAWQTRQHRTKIHPGDIVYLWESGKQAAIVAVARVLTEPSDIGDEPWESKHYATPNLSNRPGRRARIRITHILPSRLRRDTIKTDPALHGLRILHFANQTNFALDGQQAAALRRLIFQDINDGTASSQEASDAATDSDDDLPLIETTEDLRRSVQTFNRNAVANPELTRTLLVHATYWIYDADEQVFGPAKFVGFKNMTAGDYQAIKEGKRSQSRFDGHVTRTRIEEVTGASHARNTKLAARLQQWVESVYLPHGSERPVLGGVDGSKWQFLVLSPSAVEIRNWSAGEVTATVTDYFTMVAAELARKEYSKTAHRNALLKLLTNRSAPAVEFKHCNISAVLRNMGLIYISGYKPRGNYQDLLYAAVEKYLREHPGLREQMIEAESRPAPVQPDTSKVSIEEIEVPPPVPDIAASWARMPALRATTTDWSATTPSAGSWVSRARSSFWIWRSNICKRSGGWIWRLK